MAAYPYVATTFTAGLGGLQDDEVGLAGLRRSVAAVDDLDTAVALDSVRTPGSSAPGPAPRGLRQGPAHGVLLEVPPLVAGVGAPAVRGDDHLRVGVDP